MKMLSAIKAHKRIFQANQKIKRALKGDHPIVLVYQMGKVASSTIYHALKIRKDCHAFHTHYLNDVDHNLSLLQPDRRAQLSHDLKRQLILPKVPAKIITLVRDPLERNISEFFENDLEAKYTEATDENVDALIQRFINTYDHSEALNWFQNEFDPALQTEMFQHPFDADLGWSKYTDAPYEILCLKTTLPDKLKGEVIEDFLGIQNLKLIRVNETKKNRSHLCYRKFKERIQYPEHIVNAAINSEFTQRFFSQHEIEKMKNKWL